MKIGILTASQTNNNGTDLQALGMQLLFSCAGAEAELINYHCKKLEENSKIVPSASIKNFLKLPVNLYNRNSHQKFRKKHFRYSNKEFDITNINEVEYDRIVVGSDQIWNLDITGNDLGFFLPFESSVAKKYSYAASIGKTDITEWQKKYGIAQHLDKFENVSVREESGVKALEEIGVKARWDLDPLLMLPYDIWEKYAKKIQRKKPYVLLYLVEENTKARIWAKEYAKKNNLEVLMVNLGLRIFKGIKSVRFCSVEKWLWLMMNAECVVTNSYHGLSMAINFKTQVVLFELQKSVQSNTRMLSLVKRFEIEHCVVQKDIQFDNKKIDWDSTYKILYTLRDESFEYVKTICLE